MKKKLVKHGNSRALIIDRAVMEILHIDDDTELFIATEGTSLIITPARDVPEGEAERRAMFREAHEAVLRKHAPVFKRLAE